MDHDVLFTVFTDEREYFESARSITIISIIYVNTHAYLFYALGCGIL